MSLSPHGAEDASTPPIRIIGVSRVFNEEHLIEAFVRHHATLLHRHIILDNGSTDRTVEILALLHQEGIALDLYQASSAIYAESIYNTGLYRLALESGAEWVVFLDCDELLDVRAIPQGIARFLDAVPPSLPCLRLPLVNYAGGTAADANPFKRLTRRERTAFDSKIMVRCMDPARLTIGAGNHHAVIDGEVDRGFIQDRLSLGHFPQRSPHQAAAKAIIGRLKVLASGQAEAHLNLSWHYTGIFDAMKQAPHEWLAAAEQQAGEQADSSDLVDDPLPYLGGELRYPREPDDAARLITLVVSHAELLAQSHGAILDSKRLIRADLLRQAGLARRLL